MESKGFSSVHNLLNEMHKSVNSELSHEKLFKISIYYMAESASELDEANPANPVARTVKMSPFCALGISRVGPASKSFSFWQYNKSFINQACWVKMAEYCPLFFAFLLTLLTPSRSKTKKKTQKRT